MLLKRFIEKTKIFVYVCIFLFSCGLYAQENLQTPPKANFEVTQRTILAKFEEDLVLDASVRQKMKYDRILRLKKLMYILDTISLSERKKRKLLKQLSEGNTTLQWESLLADIDFQE